MKLPSNFQQVAPSSAPSRFVDQLLDWREFEGFVRDLYATDPNLVVERNVTEVGKSNARRQTDVKITQRTKLHAYVTLVECKRWKEKVDRSRVDVLWASIEDLGAAKGVIFTTTGYEEGAVEYARSKNIDIFLVRDLTEEEWGAPGRQISFFWHLFCSRIDTVAPGQAKLTPLVRKFPTDLHLDIPIEKDGQHDDALSLFSVEDGSRGPNLVSLLLDARLQVMTAISTMVPLLKNGEDGAELVLTTPALINFRNYDYRQLRYPFGAVEFEEMALVITTDVTQTKFDHDRGAKYDFALAVENFVTRQRNVVSRARGGTAQLSHPIPPPAARSEDALQNGMLLRIFTDPWVTFEPKASAQVGATNELIFELPSWSPQRGRDWTIEPKNEGGGG